MTRLSVLILALLAAVPAGAQGLSPQQERMKSCNADAATQSLSGDARGSFMSDCLSGKTAAATPAAPTATAQQQRMKDCNAEAGTKSLAGEARQRFMSSCLSGGSAAAPAAAGTTGAPAAAAQGGGNFGSEAAAKRGCGSDAVVWANPDSQVFHAAGSQFYGKTQQGGYMCQGAATKAGYRLAGGTQR